MLWTSFLDEAERQPAVMPTLTDVQAATLTCLRCGHDGFLTPRARDGGEEVNFFDHGASVVRLVSGRLPSYDVGLPV